MWEAVTAVGFASPGVGDQGVNPMIDLLPCSWGVADPDDQFAWFQLIN